VSDLSTMTCIEDLRLLAKRRVPRMFYDYADSGSWTEGTYRANRPTSNASCCASAWP
jgi:L-lactate dehydrogenase (cytochrome)